MTLPSVTELGSGRLMLDLKFRDHEGLVAGYLLPGVEGWTLIETGPSTCREALLAALGRAGVTPGEVARVIVTHIHLDHAGGLGAIARALPRATLYAHEKGVAHLVDPSRLIASARRAWGSAADPLWGTILPVPSERLRPLAGGERFPVEGGFLEVIATPGHAQHHLSFFDTTSGALFSGDSAGVRVEGGWRPRPAIPPPDLDLELLFTSLERMAEFHPRSILYSHFGPAPGAVEELRRYRRTVEEWRDAALSAAREVAEVSHVARALQRYEEAAARTAGASPSAEDRGSLVSGYELAAQGLLRYFQTRGLLSG